MNAETRAKEIIDAENQFCEEHSLFVRGDTLDRLQAAIATAIRQAENDKLEEAAAATAGAALRAIDDGSPRRQVAVAVANAARSLKSKG